MDTNFQLQDQVLRHGANIFTSLSLLPLDSLNFRCINFRWIKIETTALVGGAVILIFCFQYQL